MGLICQQGLFKFMSQCMTFLLTVLAMHNQMSKVMLEGSKALQQGNASNFTKRSIEDKAIRSGHCQGHWHSDTEVDVTEAGCTGTTAYVDPPSVTSGYGDGCERDNMWSSFAQSCKHSCKSVKAITTSVLNGWPSSSSVYFSHKHQETYLQEVWIQILTQQAYPYTGRPSPV